MKRILVIALVFFWFYGVGNNNYTSNGCWVDLFGNDVYYDYGNELVCDLDNDIRWIQDAGCFGFGVLK